MTNVASGEGAQEGAPSAIATTITPRPSQPTSNTTSILGNFLRGRPRNASQSHIVVNTQNNAETSPSPPSPGRRRGRGGSPTIQQAANSDAARAINNGGGLTGMLRRRRSAGQIPHPAPSANSPSVPPPPHPSAPNLDTATVMPPANGPNLTTTTDRHAAHRIRLVPHLDSRRSLRFEPITRTLKPEDGALKIGRFTDRTGLGLAAVNAISNNKLAFKSKVVSRTHAEISVEGDANGNVKFFIKDTKSSSGTFLNHLRLSPAGTESRKFELHDGDLLQLGVDYQGGAEDIYKSVKIRVELGAGREWQTGANAFNTNAMKNLKSLASQPSTLTNKASKHASISKGNATSTQGIPDCCICLFAVCIRQALFIAPCSHTFHYKCIRPLLDQHHPSFSCPLCRTYADLDEDVEVDQEEFLVSTTSSPHPDPSAESTDTGDNEERRSARLASDVLAAAHLSAPSGANPTTAISSERERGADTEVEELSSTHPLFGATGTLVNHSRFRLFNNGPEGILEDPLGVDGSGEDGDGERMVIDGPPCPTGLTIRPRRVEESRSLVVVDVSVSGEGVGGEGEGEDIGGMHVDSAGGSANGTKRKR